jgi:hypothetical protein
MIFVLGILVLLALMGLFLIARTHGESKRVVLESTGSSEKGAMDGMVDLVRQTLRQDIWGKPPAAGEIDVPLGDDGSSDGISENNEPYDAPGPDDRWLASTTPYHMGDKQINTPVETEEDVLAWHRVSYIGKDVLPKASDTLQPFCWRMDARTGLSRVDEEYGDANLADVPVLQTPPPGMTEDLIPGSTTNRTIAAGRAAWLADPPTAADGLPANAVPRFPYFDTNADGMLDLYDADGDGVPDSPISLMVPVETPDPNRPKALYAAVRVVDHASMVNVNAASSLLQPRGATGQLSFHEGSADRQRRGRRQTELLLDDVVHVQDSSGVDNRSAGLVDFRWNAASLPDPKVYDEDVVRRLLVGGPMADSYNIYSLRDEASLRHRNLLVPIDRLDDRSPPGCLFCSIERALPDTLLWSRGWVSTDPTKPHYDWAIPARWNRLNSNYVDAVLYEGYDDAGGKGWRSLLREDEPFAVRRQMLTTVSHEVIPPPSGVKLDPATEDFVQNLSAHPVRIVTGSNPADDVYMDWPVLHKSDYPTEAGFPDVPAHLRVLPIDLNMCDASDATGESTKQRYMQYVAAGMYLAMESGVQSYQGFKLTDNTATPPNESLNREYLAWQFAANIADYRDSDGEPTVLEWAYENVGTATEKRAYIYGVEKQPFLTEAYARIVVGSGSGGPGGPVGDSFPDDSSDQWFCAVELYVPPLWRIPTANLYIRLPEVSSSVLIPLNSFRLVSSPSTTLATLDGGALGGGGRFYVLCGTPSPAVPGDINPASFYYNSLFDIHVNGGAGSSVQLVHSPSGVWDDLEHKTHVIDVIRAKESGGYLCGHLTANEGYGGGLFATKPAGMTSGQSRAWSLQRSTKGWRLTTAWQAYGVIGPVGESGPDVINQSLGAANNTSGTLDNNVPESIWPALVSTAASATDHEPLFPRPNGSGGFTLVKGFTSGQPFEAFDSVPEISRLFMVGPIRLSSLWGPPTWNPAVDAGGTYIPPEKDVPVTVLMANALTMSSITLPGDPETDTELRAMAGRVDFATPGEGGGTPWTWRLLSYFTTQSPLYDGVDNDGSGATDLAGLDATEGVKTLNRVAGRININTAPASVLRAAPMMSFLPTSAMYTQVVGGGSPVADPAGIFSDAANAGLFWDLASAIVAERENRSVQLRLPDTLGAMQLVATAGRAAGGGPGGGSGGPGGGSGGATESGGPFASVAALAAMDNLVDTSSTHGDAFVVDRFWRKWSGAQIPLYEHLSGGDWSSPDYRYRADGTGSGLIDYQPLLAAPAGNGGLRARDIFLTRWSNMLTNRSDVFTAYIVLLDEDGNYVQRCQVTLDRSVCFGEKPTNRQDAAYGVRRPILPRVLFREDGSYFDDTK